MGIDHAGVHINADQHAATVAWYESALKPLGYKIWHTEGPNKEVVGFSDVGTHADWWVISTPETPNLKSHLAFSSKGMSPIRMASRLWHSGLTDFLDRAAVDAFHAAGLEAGGKCNGPPGVRHYHPNYYAAFVLDPAGNNVEVVCHTPVPTTSD